MSKPEMHFKNMKLNFGAAMLCENVLNSSIEVAKEMGMPPQVFLRTLQEIINGVPEELWARMEETEDVPVFSVLTAENAAEMLPTAGEA